MEIRKTRRAECCVGSLSRLIIIWKTFRLSATVNELGKWLNGGQLGCLKIIQSQAESTVEAGIGEDQDGMRATVNRI